MTDTTQKQLPEEQKKNDHKIQKTKEEINHEFIHRIVMEDLEISHIREMYTKQGISFTDAYKTRYKAYLKPQPSAILSKCVDGVMKYEAYDYEGNILNIDDETVKAFIQIYHLASD